MIAADDLCRRPRVLQLSYACSPLRGSEAGVGWHRAVQSARHCDTWVICEEHEFAGEIRQYLARHGEIPGLHFVFVPMNRRVWAWGNLHDLAWYAVLRRWHRHAYQVAKRLHERIEFDLVHQVTFCGYREPGYLWKLDAPFLWGPIGGTQNYPWRFLTSAGWRGALHEACRNVINGLQLRFSPRIRAAARRASMILAANTSVQNDFERIHGIRPRGMLETGLDGVREGRAEREENHCEMLLQCQQPSPPAPLPKGEGSMRHDGPHPRPLSQRERGDTSAVSHGKRGELRILWSGLLVHRKALHLLIEALAQLPRDVSYKLRIVGDGPMRRRWQRLAERRGIAPHLTWLGRLPFHESLEQYDWADLFAFTSLRDTSGNVVLEALAAGVPVLCLDHQGMHDIVTEQCGVKTPVKDPKQVVADLSEAVARLARNREELNRLGRGAIERAKTYLWSRQESEMTAIYRSLIANFDWTRLSSLPAPSRIAEDGCGMPVERCLTT